MLKQQQKLILSTTRHVLLRQQAGAASVMPKQFASVKMQAYNARHLHVTIVMKQQQANKDQEKKQEKKSEFDERVFQEEQPEHYDNSFMTMLLNLWKSYFVRYATITMSVITVAYTAYEVMSWFSSMYVLFGVCFTYFLQYLFRSGTLVLLCGLLYWYWHDCCGCCCEKLFHIAIHIGVQFSTKASCKQAPIPRKIGFAHQTRQIPCLLV